METIQPLDEVIVKSAWGHFLITGAQQLSSTVNRIHALLNRHSLFTNHLFKRGRGSSYSGPNDIILLDVISTKVN